MNKLTLKLEELTVESFDTTVAAPSHRGTVRGAAFSETTCQQVICDCQTNGTECDTGGCNDETLAATCGDSCTFFCSQTCPVNTCANSCEGTCGETCFC